MMNFGESVMGGQQAEAARDILPVGHELRTNAAVAVVARSLSKTKKQPPNQGCFDEVARPRRRGRRHAFNNTVR